MKSWAALRYLLADNPLTLAAAVLALFLLVGAVLGPSLAPYDPLATNTARALEPPSWDHWFGTDQVGRDIFSRLMVAVFCFNLLGDGLRDLIDPRQRT
jgi:peptide/nickel transport system permease protein